MENAKNSLSLVLSNNCLGYSGDKSGQQSCAGRDIAPCFPQRRLQERAKKCLVIVRDGIHRAGLEELCQDLENVWNEFYRYTVSSKKKVLVTKDI